MATGAAGAWCGRFDGGCFFIVVARVFGFCDGGDFGHSFIFIIRRCGEDAGGGIARGGGGELLVYRVHDPGDLDAALDAVIEAKMETRGVLEDDAFEDASLEVAVLMIEHVHDALGFVSRADDADINVGVLEVGCDVHVIHRDEHARKGMIARNDGPQLTLEEFADSDETVFHGEISGVQPSAARGAPLAQRSEI